MGLGMIAELPMIIVNVQRGGPSTGLPTKTEQADLLLTMFGRNGESPLPIVAPQSPADCFDMIQEAMRISVEFMLPVIFLSDGYIANGAEPWRIPTVEELSPITVSHPAESNSENGYLPYKRDEKHARPWAKIGTPGLEHRGGCLEKADVTGHVSYDPDNHQHMIKLRAEKVANVANFIPEQEVDGPDSGDLLVVSWGGTFGAVRTAVREVQAAGQSVAHCHLRYVNPMPRNVGDILKRFKKVLVPELNMGQLRLLLRSEFLVDAQGLNKLKGKPFLVSEVVNAINDTLAS